MSSLKLCLLTLSQVWSFGDLRSESRKAGLARVCLLSGPQLPAHSLCPHVAEEERKREKRGEGEGEKEK